MNLFGLSIYRRDVHIPIRYCSEIQRSGGGKYHSKRYIATNREDSIADGQAIDAIAKAVCA